MIDRIAIFGYRSIRSIILRLGQLNVVTGANGSGKSNLYRALRLIADAADGRLAESLAREGGFDSVRWAGPKRIGKEPVSLRLGFTADPLSYCFDLGLPQPSESMFDGCEIGIVAMDAAQRLNVSMSYISKVERGRLHFGDYPSEKFIHRLAVELEADEDELMVLADKVPKGIRQQIRQRPSLFQAIAELDDQSLDRLTRKLVKK